jgi:membrane fusion protein, multidrug efflux system
MHPRNTIQTKPSQHKLAWLLPVLITLSSPAQAQSFALERMEMRAQLSPQRYTTLSAELGAKIARISVKEGERFKAGDTLIQFDCALQAAQLDKAKAQLMGASNTFTGNQRLAELNAVGQIELGNAEAEVMKARADVAYLQATLDKCTISAPFDGRASEQKAREQQFVQPGQALLDIIDDTTLELEFIMPSRWVVWAKPGHKFNVRIEDTNKTYPVKLLRIAARADPVSQTVKAVAVVDGKYPELIAGMSGRVLLSPKK